MLNHGVPLPQVFQALGDPTRMALVERLSRGPASVSELGRPLAMTLPAVIQHLHVLEASGLIRSEKVGRVRTCRIEPAALRAVEIWVEERRATGLPDRLHLRDAHGRDPDLGLAGDDGAEPEGRWEPADLHGERELPGRAGRRHGPP